MPAIQAQSEKRSAARGSLLGIEYLPVAEIGKLLQLARKMNPLKPRPLLKGKRVFLLFYEASTRTRTSFEIAAKALGATTSLVLSSGSSVEKGESLLDTGYTLRAVGADAIVVRHPHSGAPHLMASHLDIPVINAGDGMHEHPTQALLDAYTILRHKKKLAGLQVTIVGDVYHSRVARSAIHLLSKSGARITLCGPPELVPEVATTLVDGLRISRSCEDAVRGADIVMVLLMHPGPIIRGLELTWDVADCPQSVIVEEVKNGVPLRMAVLARALGRAR